MFKILYFNWGESEDASNDSLAYPVSSIRGFGCRNATTLSIFFTSMQDTHQDTTADTQDRIDLTITSGIHRTIIKAITDEIVFGDQTFVTIANKDDEVYIHSGITDCAAVDVSS